MNSSMDRSYTLCLLARSALFAASVLALGTTMVVAQEGQPEPKSPPKATPAAPAGTSRGAACTWTRCCNRRSDLGEALHEERADRQQAGLSRQSRGA